MPRAADLADPRRYGSRTDQLTRPRLSSSAQARTLRVADGSVRSWLGALT